VQIVKKELKIGKLRLLKAKEEISAESNKIDELENHLQETSDRLRLLPKKKWQLDSLAFLGIGKTSKKRLWAVNFSFNSGSDFAEGKNTDWVKMFNPNDPNAFLNSHLTCQKFLDRAAKEFENCNIRKSQIIKGGEADKDAVLADLCEMLDSE
jgi:hypothetical protein